MHTNRIRRPYLIMNYVFIVIISCLVITFLSRHLDRFLCGVICREDVPDPIRDVSDWVKLYLATILVSLVMTGATIYVAVTAGTTA